MEKKIEILAPAGSYEGMRAAMNAGCDAVYIGGSSFGARAYANNLEEEVLLQAIDEAHVRNKKLYLTVNTLIKEKEREERLYQFLSKFYLQGLDAVIVQDVGAMHFIHRHFPGLPIHASTQTTITMAEGANLLKNIGITRLVTARELSLPEIKQIRENTDLELETFVHGALCYCYSGQCLMSSIIGGRSGNRGRCAQPCRMPYRLSGGDLQTSKQEDKYLLSPKDICTLSFIPEMVEAGIDSFKIEGRMKRPEYAAFVSFVYRKYVDLYLSLGKEGFERWIHDKEKEYTKDLMDLQDIYNRGGFSSGYLKEYHSKTMMSFDRPNHSGVYIGDVSRVSGNQVSINLKEDINAQDILEIRDKDVLYEFTIKDSRKVGDIITTYAGNRGNQKETKRDQKNRNSRIAAGNRVYRTRNNALLEGISEHFLKKDQKIPLKGKLTAKKGQRLELKVMLWGITVTAYKEEVLSAVKQPVSEEKLYEQITKTGDTLFVFDHLQIEMEDNIFVPVVWLNEIRREALRLIYKEIAGQYRRKLIEKEAPSDDIISNDTKYLDPALDKLTNTRIRVSVQTMEQFELALSYKEISYIYVDYDTFYLKELKSIVEKAGKSGKSIFLILPIIIRSTVLKTLKNDILSSADQFYGFIIKSFEGFALLQEIYQDKLYDKEIILNYNMYVYNREAKCFWKEKGIQHFTAPVELNYKELNEVGIPDCDMLVYGYLPLMVSAQCIFENTGGCRKNQQDESKKTYLTDRLQKKFFVRANCKSCYNIIYNGQSLSLLKYLKEIKDLNPRNLRLDFTLESSNVMDKVLQLFIDAYLYGKDNNKEIPEYTTGHFKRGVE